MNISKEDYQKIVNSVVEEYSKAKKLEEKQIPIGVSARHIHISRKDLDILFGEGYELTKIKDLMAGEFAAEERVTIVSSKLKSISNVRILGPTRSQTQVEISKTDAIGLGINPPIRQSGDLAGSSPITIVGPEGSVYLDEGCIIAKRHIHMGTEDAKILELVDGQVVSIEVMGERQAILQDVLIRVKPEYKLQLHIDTDEGNALGVSKFTTGRIIK